MKVELAYENSVAEAVTKIEGHFEHCAEESLQGSTISTDVAIIAIGDFLGNGAKFDDPTKLQRLLLGLIDAYFENDPNADIAKAVVAGIFNPSVEVRLLELTARDRLFAQNLLSLRRFAKLGDAPSLRPTVNKTDQGDDCLVEGHDVWSVFRLLNLAAMSSISPNRRAAIVTSIRNEGVSILEWLAHHSSMGFESFYVYTNNNTDDSNGLLHLLANHGIINLIENEVAVGVAVQSKVLEHSIALLPELREFEWVLYIDVDEYFMSRCEPDLTLNCFFARLGLSFPAGEPSAVCFNWKWFGSENVFAPTTGLLLERFVYSIHNQHVKSLVRLRDVISMRQVHIPALRRGALMVDSNFEVVESNIHQKPIYATGQVNHYWNKSFQEFAIKRSRGRISSGMGGPKLNFKSFFEWGANGVRGNFDPPQERVLTRVRVRLDQFMCLPGLKGELSIVEQRFLAMVSELDNEFGLEDLYRRGGEL